MKKGISLIALIITIVVLIILTATVILITADTNVIDKASTGVNKYNKKQNYEQLIMYISLSKDENGINLDKLNEYLSKMPTLLYKGESISEINKIMVLPAKVELDENVYTIEANGNLREYIEIVNNATSKEDILEYITAAIEEAAVETQETGVIEIKTVKVALDNDIEIDSCVNVNVNLIIEGKNHSIKRASNYGGFLFDVKENCSMTLNNTIIDGQAPNWYYDDSYDRTKSAGSASVTGFRKGDHDIEATKGVINSAGDLTFNNCTIKDLLNVASSNGNIVAKGKQTKRVSVILNNTILNHCATYAASGAVMYTEYADVSINNSKTTNCYGFGNGAIYCLYSSTILTINNSEFKNNTFHKNGLMMVYGGSKIIMNSGIMSENLGMAGSGGSWGTIIYVHSASGFEMNGGSIVNNVVNKGAIVDNAYNVEINLNGGNVSNNYAIAFSDMTAVTLQGSSLNIGNGMTIGGNIRICSEETSPRQIVNNGTINGNLLMYDTSQVNANITNNGTINGNVPVTGNTFTNNGIVTGTML